MCPRYWLSVMVCCESLTVKSGAAMPTAGGLLPEHPPIAKATATTASFTQSLPMPPYNNPEFMQPSQQSKRGDHHLASVSCQPEVSIIVPARNEEACLAECLTSLVGQADVDFELIVVDDHSSDRTRQIAQSFPAAAVVAAGPLPEGWCGKQNALHSGVRRAHGDRLLFTDAHTVHAPGSLRRALNEAQHWDAALLSYSPEQEAHTLWERAIMPVIFAELASAYPPSQVCDPQSPVAAANGQYLLMRRTAYDAVGGHAAFAGSLLEDVELARAVKRNGERIRFRLVRGEVRTRMYRSFRAMC